MLLARAEGATLGEIADEWGISKARVGQILLQHPDQFVERGQLIPEHPLHPVEPEDAEREVEAQRVSLKLGAASAPRCSCARSLGVLDEYEARCVRCGRLVG